MAKLISKKMNGPGCPCLLRLQAAGKNAFTTVETNPVLFLLLNIHSWDRIDASAFLKDRNLLYIKTI